MGNIKSFNPIKGWGFISSEEVMALLGKDIMVLMSAAEFESFFPDGENAAQGKLVSFAVTKGRNGPLATDLELIESANRGRSTPSFGVQAKSQMKMEMAFDPDMVYEGSFKSFNHAKGWGFLTSDELIDVCGKPDVMILKKDLPHGRAEVGQSVTFTMAEGHTGPLAVNVSFVDFVTEAPAAEGNGERFDGHLKSYNPQKGWGFIASEQTHDMFNKDIMVVKQDLDKALPKGDAKPGMQVSFSLAEGRTGVIAVDLDFW